MRTKGCRGGGGAIAIIIIIQPMVIGYLVREFDAVIGCEVLAAPTLPPAMPSDDSGSRRIPSLASICQRGLPVLSFHCN